MYKGKFIFTSVFLQHSLNCCVWTEHPAFTTEQEVCASICSKSVRQDGSPPWRSAPVSARKQRPISRTNTASYRLTQKCPHYSSACGAAGWASQPMCSTDDSTTCLNPQTFQGSQKSSGLWEETCSLLSASFNLQLHQSVCSIQQHGPGSNRKPLDSTFAVVVVYTFITWYTY